MLGDESRIRSKFKEAMMPAKSGDDSFINSNDQNNNLQNVSVPAALANLNKTQLNSTSQSTTS